MPWKEKTQKAWTGLLNRSSYHLPRRPLSLAPHSVRTHLLTCLDSLTLTLIVNTHSEQKQLLQNKPNVKILFDELNAIMVIVQFSSSLFAEMSWQFSTEILVLGLVL
jgi:hypothetical protein